jgi:hypothetical protein
MGNNTRKVANFRSKIKISIFNITIQTAHHRSKSQSLTLLFKSHISLSHLRPPCQPQSSNTIETSNIHNVSKTTRLLTSI